MNLFHKNENNGKYTTNSIREYKHNNYTEKRKFSNFNVNINLKNPFLLFFTLSIIITSPFGILSQIQIQTTEALHPSVINDNISGMRDKSNSNGNSNDDNSMDNNNINEIVIVPDDKPGTELSPTETTDSQIGVQSSIKSYRSHVNSNANENANVNSDDSIIVPDDKPGTELSPTATTESQIDIQSTNKVYRDHVNSNTNVNKIENIIVTDQSTTESGSTAAASSQSLSAQSANEVYGDFNGDGIDDLAIGVPGEDVDTGAGTIENAGAVNVIYGSLDGLSATSPRPDQIWTQSTTDVNDLAEPFDQFGESLSSGDFNADGRDDLAIGVILEDVDTGAGTIGAAGAVNVLYGSLGGLSATSPRPDQIWTQDTADVNDLPEDSDNFGNSLSSGDFNGDGRDDLAIGVQVEDVDTGAGTIINAGAVNVIYGSSSGLSATSPRPDQIWTQNTADVNDLAETSDFFSNSLSSGDFNGDGRDDLAIGVSGEDVDTGAGTIIDAGAVNVLYSSSNGLSATTPRPDQIWTQNTADVNDFAETFDIFGASLA